MKLIGIMGKSGSGKTTLSKMLQRDDDIAVIHLDEITNMNEIKEKLPNGLVDENLNTNNLGENFLMLNGSIRNIKEKVLKNKLLKKLYTKALKLPREILLRKNVNRTKKDKRVIIIERKYIS